MYPRHPRSRSGVQLQVRYLSSDHMTMSYQLTGSTYSTVRISRQYRVWLWSEACQIHHSDSQTRKIIINPLVTTIVQLHIPRVSDASLLERRLPTSASQWLGRVSLGSPPLAVASPKTATASGGEPRDTRPAATGRLTSANASRGKGMAAMDKAAMAVRRWGLSSIARATRPDETLALDS